MFEGEIIWGATIHTTTQLVVKYTTWAMVEVRNKPFVGFTSLACLNIGKKGKFGGFGDLVLSDICHNVSGGFNGGIVAESLIRGLNGRLLFKKISKTGS